MNPPKKIFGLIGYPVQHSLSPFMHNAAFAALKIDAEYKLFEVKPDALGDFFKTLIIEKNIFGLNVTVPHKEKAIPYLASVSNEAKLIGAVNTIKVSEGKFVGFNTDGEGFLRHLTGDLKFLPQGKVITLIGAGGAAKALAVYLSRAGIKSLAIFDIDKNKSLALITHLNKNFPGIEFILADSIEALGISKADLLINAAPVGMKEADICPVEKKNLHAGLLVYDLIYNPKETKLLNLAKSVGCKISNGLGMLLYQGVAAFELWTGKEAPVEVMRQALNKGADKI